MACLLSLSTEPFLLQVTRVTRRSAMFDHFFKAHDKFILLATGTLERPSPPRLLPLTLCVCVGWGRQQRVKDMNGARNGVELRLDTRSLSRLTACYQGPVCVASITSFSVEQHLHLHVYLKCKGRSERCLQWSGRICMHTFACSMLHGSRRHPHCACAAGWHVGQHKLWIVVRPGMHGWHGCMQKHRGSRNTREPCAPMR